MVRSGIDAQRIFVIGSGVVGAATGRGFRAAGHDVTFIDTSLQAVVDTNERLEHLVAAAEIGGTTRDSRAHVPGRQAAVADVA